MSKSISILLADDHALVRNSLGERLRAEPDMTVVGEVPDAEQAVEQAIQLHPDVVVLDIDMPGLLCFDAARTILSRCPETRVVFLSAFFHDRYIEQALAVRASAYITKGESLATIIEALRKVASGRSYYSPEVQSRIVVDDQGARLAEWGRTRASRLSARELEVLRYIAQGLAKKQIASLMHVSIQTVEVHSRNLMRKLDIHDRVELARFAIREGLAEA